MCGVAMEFKLTKIDSEHVSEICGYLATSSLPEWVTNEFQLCIHA